MEITLKKYTTLIYSQGLEKVLEKPLSVETEDIGLTAELGMIRRVHEELLRKKEGKKDRAWWDAELVEPIHNALKIIPRRIASDMRFWQWLCVSIFPEVVWGRWYGPVPAQGDIPRVLEGKSALRERFLGSASLRGISRNTFARLWWCGESLVSGDKPDDYSSARKVLEKQDLFQNIFEREFGLFGPAARACLRKYGDASEKEWRKGTALLNYYLSTIALETLNEEEIHRLLV